MAERVVRNVENDYLMCAICLGRYTDPRLLPCGHTFCKQCLTDHIKQTVTDRAAGWFKCPNDRTQIQRPSLALPPKDWAGEFPVDTFLVSLLNAVMTHGTQGEGDSQLKCDIHKGRPKEFYCIRCSKAVCAYCVVKQHKGDNCECISIEEAVDKFKPKIDSLRIRLRNQVVATKKLMTGESTQNNSLKDSKEKAMSDLTDLETKITFFYQTALRQLLEMKTTIRETGTRQLTENQQASVILGKINDSAEKLEEICSHGNGFNILNTISQLEGQVRDYDGALKSLGSQPSRMEVHFVVNRDLEKVFENMPALGSVVVQSRSGVNRSKVRPSLNLSHQVTNSVNVPNPSTSRNAHTSQRAQPTSARTFGGMTPRESMALSMNWSPDLSTPEDTPRNTNTTPRVTPTSARTFGGITPRESMALSLNWTPDSQTPEDTPRSTGGTSTRTTGTGRRRSIPTRAKVTFNVQTPEILTSCWQLTGIVIIEDYMIITDAHNGHVLKCEFSSASTVYDVLTLECPVCIAKVPDSFTAVVTLPEKSELALVDTETALVVKETIVTAKPYEGIACLPDEKCAASCCVVGKQCVDIITMDGGVVKTIANDSSSGQPLFSWPRFISATLGGNIVVSDRDNRSLLCVDPSGTVKWTYTSPASPWGVSVHDAGSIFLCLDNNVVQVLSDTGRVLQNRFLSARDGVRIPYAICARGDRAAVTEWGPSLFSPNSPLLNVFSI